MRCSKRVKFRTPGISYPVNYNSRAIRTDRFRWEPFHENAGRLTVIQRRMKRNGRASNNDRPARLFIHQNPRVDQFSVDFELSTTQGWWMRDLECE